jgi:hypothetical protein
MTAHRDLKPLPAPHDWPALIARCPMGQDQAAFYARTWYAAGLAWVLGVGDDALAAICDVVRVAANSSQVADPAQGGRHTMPSRKDTENAAAQLKASAIQSAARGDADKARLAEHLLQGPHQDE